MKIDIVNIALVDEFFAARVLERCMRQFPHARKSILMAPTNPKFGNSQFIRLPFLPKVALGECVLSIGAFTDADVVIYVQNDGFILNGSNWRWEFLDYDYIGTPWPVDYPGGQRIGGGGFSLRSRKLMDACLKTMAIYPSSIPPPHTGEDFWISTVMRTQFELEGIRYAPLELAEVWGNELPCDDSKCFGFHKFNTPEREKIRESI